jgi:hypothetical protein
MTEFVDDVMRGGGLLFLTHTNTSAGHIGLLGYLTAQRRFAWRRVSFMEYHGVMVAHYVCRDTESVMEGQENVRVLWDRPLRRSIYIAAPSEFTSAPRVFLFCC